jgi:hypothetical protein
MKFILLYNSDETHSTEVFAIMNNTNMLRGLTDELKCPEYNSFPDIELYMDQVLDFLLRSRTSLRDDERLSSAMVNNYIKADILPRARGKKYSREHLVHLVVILRLKQVLSVRDTGALIKSAKENKSDEAFYEGFRKMLDDCAAEIVEKALAEKEDPADAAMRLAVESYLCKVACEHLLDQIGTRDEDHHEHRRTEKSEKNDRIEKKEE